jgi:Sugar phosphate isomerases/epimerases
MARFATAGRGRLQREDGDVWRGLKVGVATYSLRTLPTDAAIKAAQRVGVRYVSIKDVHLSLKTNPEERRAVTQRFRDAGLTPLSCGTITLQNNEGNPRDAFQYAKDAGIPTIVCSPHPDSMPILDRLVKEFDIRIAIHNHGPEDKRFASPYDAWKVVEKFDRRLGLCIDVGHTARAGVDPAEAIRRCRERLYDVHLKDIVRREARTPVCEVGRGALDIPGILRALLEIGFAHHVGFEYEKDANDPLPGLAESVGYVRGVLKTMR